MNLQNRKGWFVSQPIEAHFAFYCLTALNLCYSGEPFGGNVDMKQINPCYTLHGSVCLLHCAVYEWMRFFAPAFSAFGPKTAETCDMNSLYTAKIFFTHLSVIEVIGEHTQHSSSYYMYYMNTTYTYYQNNLDLLTKYGLFFYKNEKQSK